VAARKFTRKELRQDGFVKWTERTLEYVQENYVKAAVIAAVVVVVLVGGTYIRNSRLQAHQKASALLYQGQSMLSIGSYESARARLQECVERFGGGDFGDLARLGLAEAQIGLGENELALQTLGEAMAAIRAEDALYTSFLTVQATAQANLERYDDAATTYEQALTGELLPVQRYDLTLRQADALRQAGRTAAGLVLLENLQTAIDEGKLDIPARDLGTRIDLYRALAR
jgi:predicted negative regulator of RcsB-dependent stress response